MKQRCSRIKLWIIIICGILVFSGIYYRLFQLQIQKHGYYLSQQERYKYQTHTTVRKDILDRNRQVLATNTLVVGATLYLHNNATIELTHIPSRLGFFEQVVKYVPFWDFESEFLDLKDFNDRLKNRLSERFSSFSSERTYSGQPVLVLNNLPLTLERHIRSIIEEERLLYASTFSPEIQPRVRRILQRHIRQNFRIDIEPRRSYLYDRTASHVLGYVNMEGPQKGAEFFLDQIISQERHLIPRNSLTITSAMTENLREGETTRGDAVLTIDLDIQKNTEKILKEHLDRVKAPKGFAIVMDPNNGEIIALANFPDYNPEKIGLYYNATLKHERFQNIAMEERFEPGSILKVFPIAAAIEEEITDLDMEYDLKKGYWYIPALRKTVRDSHPRDNGTVRDIIKYSSNIGTVKIAMEMGREKLYEYLRRFHLDENYNIYAYNQQTLSLPQRRSGIYPLSRWTGQSITMVPMGHEVAFTGIQILASFNALVNGGIFHSPSVVRALVNSNGDEIPLDNSLSERVISSSTSAKMRHSMQAATEYHVQYEHRGTGSRARFINYPHVSCGGKTGTAQFFDRESGSYHSTRYVSSFIGFFPVNNPEYTILATVFFPDYSSRYGGEAAAPIFRDIGEMILALNEKRGEE